MNVFVSTLSDDSIATNKLAGMIFNLFFIIINLCNRMLDKGSSKGFYYLSVNAFVPTRTYHFLAPRERPNIT